MQISAVDQLVVVSDGDSYASAMGVMYPTGGGNAQYYDADGSGKVTKVQPEFADENGKRLGYYPLLFSVAEGKYMQPADTDYFEFRFNNATSDAAIIAKGTLAQFRSNSAVQSGTWSTAEQGKAQTYAQVFKTGTVTISNGTGDTSDDSEFPVLYIIGQPAYRTKADIDFFCTSKVGDVEILSKGSMEIRSLTTDNYKVIIEATSNKESNANDQVINFTDETITLKATLLKNGSSQGVTPTSYKWHYFGKTASLGATQSLAVTESMVGGVDEFVCDVALGNNTYSASITIHDIQDEYMVDKGRTTKDGSTTVENSGIIKPSYTITYNPKVIKKSTGAEDTTAGWTFSYQKKSASGADAGTGTGKPYTVSGSDVVAAGGSMIVIISATNSNI